LCFSASDSSSSVTASRAHRAPELSVLRQQVGDRFGAVDAAEELVE
jgi:hypothetical protein